MRERLIAAFVGMTVAVIALYGVPRAYFLADLVQQQEERKIERSADLLAVLITERETDARRVDEAFLAGLLNEAEEITSTSADGTVVSTVEPGGTEERIAATRAVADGGTITLARSSTLVDERVAGALTPLVFLGLALTGMSAVTGFALAKRMSRPFQELAGAAKRLGAGRFDVELPHYSVPEAEGIAEALRRSAAQLEALVRREREFAVNASHQLRTPITALRFELEDLAAWPETPATVSRELEESLTELDRLGDAITELLGLARGHRRSAADDVDLVDVVADVVDRWRPRIEQHARSLAYEQSGRLPAQLSTGPVCQILDVLIENACDHGRGDITVETLDTGTHLEVRVSDTGTRTFGPEVFRRGVSGDGGPGVGLAVAAELAGSIDGRLALDDSRTTTFVLMLPRGSVGTRRTSGELPRI